MVRIVFYRDFEHREKLITMEQLYALRKFQSSMQMNRKAAINAIVKLKENNLKRTASECSNNSNQGTGERPEQALKHGLEAENQN